MEVMSSILWGFFDTEVGARQTNGQAALPEKKQLQELSVLKSPQKEAVRVSLTA